MKPRYIFFYKQKMALLKLVKPLTSIKDLKLHRPLITKILKIIGSFPGNSTIEKYLHNKFQKQNIRGEMVSSTSRTNQSSEWYF